MKHGLISVCVFGALLAGCNDAESSELTLQTGEEATAAFVAKSCPGGQAVAKIQCEPVETFELEIGADFSAQKCNYGFSEGGPTPHQINLSRNDGENDWGWEFQILPCAEDAQNSTASTIGAATQSNTSSPPTLQDIRDGFVDVMGLEMAPNVTSIQCTPVQDARLKYCCNYTIDGSDKIDTVGFWRDDALAGWHAMFAHPSCNAAQTSSQQQVTPLN